MNVNRYWYSTSSKIEKKNSLGTFRIAHYVSSVYILFVIVVHCLENLGPLSSNGIQSMILQYESCQGSVAAILSSPLLIIAAALNFFIVLQLSFFRNLH